MQEAPGPAKMAQTWPKRPPSLPLSSSSSFSSPLFLILFVSLPLFPSSSFVLLVLADPFFLWGSVAAARAGTQPQPDLWFLAHCIG